jgi:hypothetical protein
MIVRIDVDTIEKLRSGIFFILYARQFADKAENKSPS